MGTPSWAKYAKLTFGVIAGSSGRPEMPLRSDSRKVQPPLFFVFSLENDRYEKFISPQNREDLLGFGSAGSSTDSLQRMH